MRSPLQIEVGASVRLKALARMVHVAQHVFKRDPPRLLQLTKDKQACRQVDKETKQAGRETGRLTKQRERGGGGRKREGGRERRGGGGRKREGGREREREGEGEGERERGRGTDKLTGESADRQTDRWTGRHTPGRQIVEEGLGMSNGEGHQLYDGYLVRIVVVDLILGCCFGGAPPPRPCGWRSAGSGAQGDRSQTLPAEDHAPHKNGVGHCSGPHVHSDQ